MIRPEVAVWIARWREVGFGLLILGLGFYWAYNAVGIMLYISFVLVVVGGGIVWVGARRARFPAAGGGPGVVEVDERRITYFGPDGGDAVSIDALTRVEVITTDGGPMATDLFWIFHTEDGAILQVPGDAEGVGALFDALAALPGVDYAAATMAAGSTEAAIFPIWERPQNRLH